MTIGTLLVGLAFLVVVVAYLARPFRTKGKGVNPERAIELWVAQIREEHEMELRTDEPAGPGRQTDRINFCPACGRRVGPGDRFCSGCGTRLGAGEA